MSKGIARLSAALFIAVGAMSMAAPAMAADTKSSIVEVQPKGTYQTAWWNWPA